MGEADLYDARWYCTALAGILVFNSTFVSTVPQGTMDDILKQFGVAQEVGTLTISVCFPPLLIILCWLSGD